MYICTITSVVHICMIPQNHSLGVGQTRRHPRKVYENCSYNKLYIYKSVAYESSNGMSPILNTKNYQLLSIQFYESIQVMVRNYTNILM